MSYLIYVMLTAKTMVFRSSRQKTSDFEALWERERPRVWRMTARLSGNADVADDLTQEVGLRALAAYPRFHWRASASTWLYRIAVNLVLRWREQQRATVREGEKAMEFLVSALPTPEGCALRGEITTQIQKALDRLPDDLRTPLLLHVWEGLKYREIAEMLEIPQGTVMSRLHSARQHLRRELKDWEDAT